MGGRTYTWESYGDTWSSLVARLGDNNGLFLCVGPRNRITPRRRSSERASPDKRFVDVRRHDIFYVAEKPVQLSQSPSSISHHICTFESERVGGGMWKITKNGRRGWMIMLLLLLLFTPNGQIHPFSRNVLGEMMIWRNITDDGHVCDNKMVGYVLI